MIAGLVLAAGASRRFGAQPKQLAHVGGRPLLERAASACLEVAELAPVFVTLGAHADEIAAAVDLGAAQPLRVPDWREGVAASLRAGVAAADRAGADAVLVVLGDQAWLTPEAVAAVVRAWDGAAPAVRAVHAGRPGHPVLLARALFAAVGELRGDEGARTLLARVPVREVALGAGAVRDVDLPADLG